MTKLDDVVEAAERLVADARDDNIVEGYCDWCRQVGHWEKCAVGVLAAALDALHASECPIEKLDETDAVLALTEPEPEAGGSVRG